MSTKTDQRLIYLETSYKENQSLLRNKLINEIEYEVFIENIEAVASEIWGSPKVFYDFLKTQKLNTTPCSTTTTV